MLFFLKSDPCKGDLEGDAGALWVARPVDPPPEISWHDNNEDNNDDTDENNDDEKFDDEVFDENYDANVDHDNKDDGENVGEDGHLLAKALGL